MAMPDDMDRGDLGCLFGVILFVAFFGFILVFEEKDKASKQKDFEIKWNGKTATAVEVFPTKKQEGKYTTDAILIVLDVENGERYSYYQKAGIGWFPLVGEKVVLKTDDDLYLELKVEPLKAER